MKNTSTKVIEVTYVTRAGGAYSKTKCGKTCYLPVNMATYMNIQIGDVYFATVKQNYAEQLDTAEYIALKLDADHQDSSLVDEEDEVIPASAMVDYIYDEDVIEEVVTPDTPKQVVNSVPATPSLREARDHLYSILLNMGEGELSDMILETLRVEPMGFVDILWSILSVTSVRYKDMNEIQTLCYQKIASKCVTLLKLSLIHI